MPHEGKCKCILFHGWWSMRERSSKQSGTLACDVKNKISITCAGKNITSIICIASFDSFALCYFKWLGVLKLSSHHVSPPHMQLSDPQLAQGIYYVGVYKVTKSFNFSSFLLACFTIMFPLQIRLNPSIQTRSILLLKHGECPFKHVQCLFERVNSCPSVPTPVQAWLMLILVFFSRLYSSSTSINFVSSRHQQVLTL
jgi:hypothetical protein